MPPNPQRLVLASASPRRLELLRQIDVEPDAVDSAGIDESRFVNETPAALALRLACAKSAEAARRHPGAFVLAADTVVAVGRRVLPKAETKDEIGDCLRLLSGRTHRVLTAVSVQAPDARSAHRLVEARVSFKRLDLQDVERYLASGEGLGKAGGYAIQGRAGAFVTYLRGSYSAVVGLPLYETLALLTGLGRKAP